MLLAGAHVCARHACEACLRVPGLLVTLCRGQKLPGGRRGKMPALSHSAQHSREQAGAPSAGRPQPSKARGQASRQPAQGRLHQADVACRTPSRRLGTLKVSILPKSLYRFNAIPSPSQQDASDRRGKARPLVIT